MLSDDGGWAFAHMRTVYTGQAHETDLTHTAHTKVGPALVPGTPAVMVRTKTEPSPLEN